MTPLEYCVFPASLIRVVCGWQRAQATWLRAIEWKADFNKEKMRVDRTVMFSLLSLVAFMVETRCGQPHSLPGITNILDLVIRRAARLSKVISDPFISVARGVIQNAGQTLVKDPDVSAAYKGVVCRTEWENE